MKNKLYLLLFVFLITNAFAQGDSQLNYFRGGTFKTKVSFSNTLFMGIGSRVGGMGGDYGGLFNTSESILWNPANLSLISGSQLTLDFKPGLMVDPGRFVDIPSEIRTAVDENIADIRGPDLVLRDEDYPEVDVRVGEKSSIGTGSFAFRFRNYVIAGAFYQPVRASFGLTGSGFEIQMETQDEVDPTKDVTFFSSIDLNLNASIKTQAISIGIARQINPKWSLGASVERLSGSAEALARIQVEGIMLIAGNERAFNDPNDPWENKLHTRFVSKYTGSSNSLRLGATYKLNGNWGIGTALSLGHKLKMRGALDAEEYKLTGLNLNAEENENLLDVTELDLDEPTKTIRQDSLLADLFQVEFPGTFGLGVSGRIGFFGISLNYVNYFGQLSYQYMTTRGSKENEYYQALQIKNVFRLGLDFKILRIGLGLGTGTLFDESGDAAVGDKVIVPNLSIATSIKASKRISADVLFVAIPSGVGKLAFRYQL